EVLAVTAEQAGEFVELALGKVQLGKAVRIAAEPAGKGFQVIDERVLRVRQRAQFKSLAQYARTGLLVHKSVIHGTAAVDIGQVSAQIDRLMKRVALRSGLVR